MTSILPRHWPRVLAFLASLAILVAPGLASAQSGASITVSQSSFFIIREKVRSEFPYVANREDCLKSTGIDDDDSTYFQFVPKIVTAGINGLQLEVWLGTADCTDLNNRQGSGDKCTRVSVKPALKLTGQKQRISVRDVARALQDFTQQDSNEDRFTGTEADCDYAFNSRAANFYFLLTDGSTDSKASDAKNGKGRFTLDFAAPDVPTEVVVSAGDQYLFPEWTGTTTNDLVGFRFYCSSVGSGASGNGGQGGTSGSGSCGSSSLTPNEWVPVGTPSCGSVTGQIGANHGRTDKLENGQSYALGVVALDKYGNESKLSELGCGTPQAVTTFFEGYRAAGGEGGGGFCSFGLNPASAPGALVMLGLAYALRSLRRRGGAR